MCQVYWNFGGSTVSTRRCIRLTPATQDRRGWLWNEYPLEADNWEVEFKAEVRLLFGADSDGCFSSLTHEFAGYECRCTANLTSEVMASAFGC